MYKIGRFTFDTQKLVLMIDDKSNRKTHYQGVGTAQSALRLGVMKSLNVTSPSRPYGLDDNYFHARPMDAYITKLRKSILRTIPPSRLSISMVRGYKLIAPEVETAPAQ